MKVPNVINGIQAEAERQFSLADAVANAVSKRLPDMQFDDYKMPSDAESQQPTVYCKRQVSTVRTPAAGRRKLWAIPAIFHCSLLGLCLGIKEMRQLAPRLGIKNSTSHTDYLLHHKFVHIAQHNDRAGKRLHRYLENKYKDAVPELRKADTDAGIQEHWVKLSSEDSEHDIGAVYWSLLTNGATAEITMDTALNEVHMFSHKAASSLRRAHAELRRAQLAQKEAEITLDREQHARAKARKRIEDLEATIRHQACELAELAQVRATNRDLDRRLQEVQPALRTELELARIKEALATCRDTASHWQQQAETSSAELESLKGEHRVLRDALDTLEGEDSAETPPVDLNGATIMYIGGRGHVVPRLREITIRMNGNFVHHDGGLEDRVTNVRVSGADLLVVALDCVSHNAANVLKKQNRILERPVAWVRNSSISAFVRAVVQFSAPT